jgi:hypothetical protein
MNKKWRVTLLTAVAILALSVFPLAAQNLPEIPEPESNTSRATVGNFGTDVDDFLDVHSYGDVKFDKWFGYGGFVTTSGQSTGLELNLGYARRLGDLYLGAFYAGQITEWNNGSAGEDETTDTTTTTNTLTGGTYQQTGENNTTSNNSTNTPYFYNNLGVLIGIGGMGIKVGFYEDLQGSDKYNGTASDITTAGGVTTVNADISDYSKLTGWMAPYLGWGMQLPLGDMLLKPKVGANLNFRLNYEKYTAAARSASNSSSPNVSNNGTPVGTHGTVEYYRDEGYFAPVISLGADLDFAEQDSSQIGVGLTYDIAFGLYGRDYDTASGSDSVTGIVNGYTYTGRTVTAASTTDVKSSSITAAELSAIQQTITPSFWYANDLSETVSVGLGYELGLSFGHETSHTKRTVTNIETVNYNNGNPWRRTTTVTVTDGPSGNNNTETTTFGIESALSAGISWKLVPDKFTVNTGLSITLPSYESETVLTVPNEASITRTDVEYADGRHTSSANYNPGNVTTVTESTEVTQTWGGLYAVYSLGGAFAFTPNFVADMLLTNQFNTIDNAGAVTLNITNIQFSLLFSLKI